jgi:predicted GNAT family N-acyltransferase
MNSSGEILIRLAKIEEILDLRWTILREGLPRESANFEGDTEPNTYHFAAIVDDERVACATFLRRPFKDESAWQLRGMAVRRDVQKSHIGRRLLQFAERFVLDQKYSSLLWCNARVPASPFYVKQGWTIVSEPFDIPSAGPHLKMIKRIDSIVR